MFVAAYASQDGDSSLRTGKALIAATRPFAKEHRATSWWLTLSSFAMLGVLLAGTFWAPFWPAKLVFSVLAGLTSVRCFILYHDFMHGALLRNSHIARVLFYLYSVWVLTPPRVWRQTHNYHHAHTAKIVGSHIGSYHMATTDMWQEMTWVQRLAYRVKRHPLTIALGYFTIFIYGMCIASFLRSPRRHWDSLVVLLAHLGGSAFFFHVAGLHAYLFSILIPVAVACMVGAYLFYAQHNFPDVRIAKRENWAYTQAALESSSYMHVGPFMHWFMGNIGYHHVHHLNPSIPFYRLPEAMRAIPELQSPLVTSLRPSDILACFQLKLWDPIQGRMVDYPKLSQRMTP